jgi:acylphosphatase
VSLKDSTPLSGQEIKSASEEMLRIPAFEVTGVVADVKNQDVNIAGISTAGAALLVKRLEDGPLNVETLAGPPASPSGGEASGSGAGDSPSPWAVTLQKLSVKDYSVTAKDLVQETGAGVLIDHIDIDGEKISTKKNETATMAMSCRINESGLLRLEGDFGLSPLKAGIKTGLEKLNLASIQPFAAPYFPGLISQGDFSLSGDLSLETGEDGSPVTLFKGDIGLSNFGSVDTRHSEDLIKFKALKIKGLDLGTSPMKVAIDEIGLDKLFARIGIDSKGKVNLIKESADQTSVSDAEKADEGAQQDKDVKEDKTEVETDKKASEPIPITIGKITLSGGHIQFSDKSLSPGYRTELTNINAQLKDLSSKQDKVASLVLKGILDRQAKLEVKGRVNPLAEELLVDLKIKFQNMGLSGLSPYSGKYIGQKVAKGKLFLDLSYEVKKKKLKAENLVFLDQFTLGEKVESEDSVNLPVDLAISLLKDRRGKIVLNVPIAGSLDEPEFSLGGIILQAFVNILTKAATAPFSLISGAMGGEDASHLEFQFGSHEITDTTRGKLDKLAEFLSDRPGLTLEVSGFVDRENDGRELVRYLFEKKLKARKLADIIKSGKKAIPVDEVQIEEKEYEKYLQKAYKKETFKKPKNFLGLNKTLPPEEAEALILKHIKVTEGDLKDLADRRGKMVRDYLLKSEKVGPERVFLVEPPSLEPEAADSVQKSRVDLGFRS